MLWNAVREIWVAVAQGVERKKKKGGGVAAAKLCIQQECKDCSIFEKMPNSIILRN